MDITVVGGGLAGLTAAIASAERGANVTLWEAHERLGGRARSTEPPYVVNDGPHALYSDGAPYAWLADRDLLPPLLEPTAAFLAGTRFRHGGRVGRLPSAGLIGAIRRRRLRAPRDRDFAAWGRENLGVAATRAVCGFLGVTTYEADPGRLSAEFVWERFTRVTALRSPSVRYPRGGWGSLVGRMASRAEEMGVRIETGVRVTELPGTPTIVATALPSARSLLGDGALAWESGHSLLVDLGLRRRAKDPTIVFDLDESGFVECYSFLDRGIVPEGETLYQAQLPVRADESRGDVTARMEHLLEDALPGWRERVTWRRDQMCRGRTGALDLPGRTWRDRPAIDQGDGVFLAGDAVAAPGLLGEVSIASGIAAAEAAATGARVFVA
ncbi:NAD(P)/FAD-dependent oxidoreductase [Nocardiopsis sp. FIRDI 009]|uniref:NAD(P)/FAD-dependent oxidoreductase n=1 Tax=Nocardiopsis sp. FIRDI 009 TaxID=714197 RepID=UPI000E236505|nr:NAD(P)/FAD-dependent oxidoreductase [Nocardiopsis sp. FIRDI 009]